MVYKCYVATLAMGLLLSGSVFAAQEVYTASNKETKINWRGYKIIKKYDHKGTINLLPSKKSQITFKDDKPVKAEFYVDMHSIVTTDDMDAKDKAKLVGHLKSDDFFGVNQKGNEISTLVLDQFTRKSGNSWDVKGKMTVKGITKPINLKIEFEKSGKKLTGNAEFAFNRTDFNVMYNSKSLLKKMSDKVIADDIELKINLVAEKTEENKS